MITLKWPLLILILPLPYIINTLRRRISDENSFNSKGLIIPFFEDISKGLEKTSTKQSLLRSLLLFLCWTVFVVAAMRPVFLGKPISLSIPTHDIIMAIDISGSMQADDMSDRFRQTRLDVVKIIAHDFLTKRLTDRIGLVFFGSQAFLSSPLTLDQDSLHSFLDKTEVGFAGQRTAIGDAIGLAVKRLKIGNESNNTKFIILLSDGSNTSGEVDPVEAAKIAAKHNIKVYTIGIGKISNNVFDLQAGMSLDEETLKQIAKLTNGLYFHADNRLKLANIYEKINQLEPNDKQEQTIRPESEYYIYPLLLGLFLSMILVLTKD